MCKKVEVSAEQAEILKKNLRSHAENRIAASKRQSEKNWRKIVSASNWGALADLKVS